MPKTTTNYGFKKPLYTENADIKVINDNFEMIDVLLTPTVDATNAPGTNSKGKLLTVLGWIANRIKSITGLPSWQDTPSVTLEDCSAHINQGFHDVATTTSDGFMSSSDKTLLNEATSLNISDTLVRRDLFGRIKTAAPSSSSDVATKGYTDGNFVKKNAATAMSAQLTAYSNTSYSTRQVRNIVLWTGGSTPPGTSNGDIVIKTF